MSLKAVKEFVDPNLYKNIGGFINEKLYRKVKEISNNETDTRCISFACDIFTLSTPIISPKNLVLYVHLHHEHGSKNS